MSEVTESSLVDAMLGNTADVVLAKEPVSSISTVVALLEHAGIVERRTGNTVDVSLQLFSREIVGVAALDGAATALLRVLAGRVKPASGIVKIPAEIGFVPENRKDEAIIEDFSLIENLALAGAGERRGLIEWRGIELETQAVISAFDVRTSGTGALPAELSGGNQQRFVLGRELRNHPPLLVLENPTQGLDIHASAFVHGQVRNARNTGSAIVFYSSDLDELADLSDRVIVMAGSRLIDVPPDRDAIGRALLGAEAE
jgi:simple sugar transport system ATP-binding protein